MQAGLLLLAVLLLFTAANMQAKLPPTNHAVARDAGVYKAAGATSAYPASVLLLC
jgi:hypothetical protein